MTAKSVERYPLADTGLGFSLYIDPMDSYGLLNNAQRYEEAEVDVCRQLLANGMRVLDIGANMGYLSVLFSKWVGPTGEVFAFEPDAHALELLTKNLALNDTRNVRVMPVALADKTGTSTLYRCPFNVGMHRLYPSVCCDDEGELVQSRAGDELALGPIDFVKIDIEGFELPALRGLENTLRQNPALTLLSEYSPLAMLEAGYHPQDFINFMRSLNFRAMVQNGAAWLAADWSLLERTSALFTADNFARFRTEAAKVDKAELLEVAQRYLADIQYPRAYYENLVILAPRATIQLA